LLVVIIVLLLWFDVGKDRYTPLLQV
jgi:hypothetical protein